MNQNDNWINQEIDIPKIYKQKYGYNSKYVSAKTSDGKIHKARLEGSNKDNLFWYAENTCDQLDDVVSWKYL